MRSCPKCIENFLPYVFLVQFNHSSIAGFHASTFTTTIKINQKSGLCFRITISSGSVASHIANEQVMTTLKAIQNAETVTYLGTPEVALRADWPQQGQHHELAASMTRPLRKLSLHSDNANVSPSLLQAGDTSALFMSETIDELNIGAHFLNRLTSDERMRIRELGRRIPIRQGETVFTQGEQHDGIFIIERGQVRVYYTAPSGREITLAYWTPGHFIGGPEISGGGAHMWSGVAIDDCEILLLPSAVLQKLLTQMPNFAMALVGGLVAKGKCYSSMAQMLGTRSVIERLAQYLLNLSVLYGSPAGSAVIINRKVTHDQIAAMVGSTRQWVTMMLKRFQAKRIMSIEAGIIRIERIDLLEQILFKE
jgi:CRP-like cAMP-binding protein